jgi:hypothetical protein
MENPKYSGKTAHGHHSAFAVQAEKARENFWRALSRVTY